MPTLRGCRSGCPSVGEEEVEEVVGGAARHRCAAADDVGNPATALVAVASAAATATRAVAGFPTSSAAAHRCRAAPPTTSSTSSSPTDGHPDRQPRSVGMRGRGRVQSLAASPTMVGAITTLIVIVAVFLAYNASNGLPFVPVYRISAILPNAARLSPNNEVRIGGSRVGVVESIEPVINKENGKTAAKLNLKLDKSVQPLPADTHVRVRYKSS